MSNEINVIIYASDIGEGSRTAFHVAVKEAISHHAEIIYVHAVDKVNKITPDASHSLLPKNIEKSHSAQHKESIISNVRNRINRFVTTELSTLEAFPHFSIHIQFGSPEEVIVNASKQYNAGMIVMGNREVSALSRVFLGSTSHKVLQESVVPVLIVPIVSTKSHKVN
ncbi:universal stress protein [Vibrio sp. DW001]|uniref:universal stress protein n=1 Tax=Vibrio sp. DW001 TaxID=2912315 RepID=UPI0023AF5144|nr:universal stress protein [Vibrio sp. DW001]WED25283.1 universal stress protein [Vibrio sp. DW001]